MSAYARTLMLALTIFGIGCTEPQTNNEPDQGTAPADMPAPTDDGGETTPDEGTPDMSEPVDMEPEECPGVARCDKGYDFDDDCVCRSSLFRDCDSDDDCRAGETCRTFQSDRGRDYDVCFFDESQLAVQTCPGGPGCAGDNSGELLAWAVSKSVTPLGFETPLPAGLDGSQLNFNPGQVNEQNWRDCGYDGICPGEPDYPGPDRGEGDGEMQGMWIAGFSNGRPAQLCPEERIGCDAPDCCISKWAHDDIRVQISVLRKGDVTVAFAVLDTVGFFRDDIELIRRQVSEEAELDLLVMAATHVHEAPDTVGQWGPGTALPLQTGIDPVFMKRIRDETVAGIEEAVANLVPAELFVGIADEGPGGLAMNDSRNPYILDDNIPIVRIMSKEGAPIATMLSVANHPEVLWSGNPYLTSDYFHFAREYVRDGLDAAGDKPALDGMGGVTVLFAGALGGLIYPRTAAARAYDGTEITELGWEKADALGQRVAEIVLGASERGELQKIDVDAISFATKSFLTPIRNDLFLLAALQLRVFTRDIYNAQRITGTNFVPDFPEVMSQVAVVRVGPLTFFTAPGEAFPELLVGGYPGKTSTQNPTIGDLEEVRFPSICDEFGMPMIEGMGDQPCVIRLDAENPPDFTMAPDGPYAYDLVPGEYPFFIGLGMDFLGYMVPPYDFQYLGPTEEPPGDHYEETNSASGDLVPDWQAALQVCLDAL